MIKLFEKFKNTYRPSLPVTELYVAEYSPNQNQFHHHTLIESVWDACQTLKEGAKVKGWDWIIFYVGTQEGAYKAIDDMRTTQAKTTKRKKVAAKSWRIQANL